MRVFGIMGEKFEGERENNMFVVIVEIRFKIRLQAVRFAAAS